jgi:putative membrane protein
MRSEPAGAAPAPTVPPRRLHPATPLFLAIKQARQLIPLLAIVLIQRRLIILVIGALIVMAITVLQWMRRTWTLDGRAIRIDEGVLGRRRRMVPFDRIQQVSLVRKPVHRVLGVATLRVETAGGSGGSEVDLDVVSLADATWLRDTLVAAKAAAAVTGPGAGTAPAVGGGTGEPPAPPPERVVARLGLGDVVLAGVTGARAAAALAILGPLFQYGDDIGFIERFMDRLDPERLLEVGPVVAALAGIGAIVVWFALAAGSSILTDYGFTMVLRGGDLVVRRGLLERREAVLPLGRVQVVRIDESLVRRALGFGSIRVSSAGAPGRRDTDAARVAIPILPRAGFDEVLGLVLPGAAPLPALERPPPAARRRAVSRRLLGTLPAAAAFTLLGWFAIGVPALGVTAGLVLLGLAVPAGLASWRHMGSAMPGAFVYARDGVLVRTTSIVPAVKAQSARVTATVFQRRAGLATFHVDVAGSSAPHVLDAAAARATQLLRLVVARSRG